MRIQPAPPEHFVWLAGRAGLAVGDQFRALEAVDDSGRIHGMVGFDAWTPNAVTLSIALDNPAALRMLAREGFHRAFVRHGRGVVLCTVLSSNMRSQRLVRHLGFRERCRLADAWEPGVDLVVFEMRREQCRWIDAAQEAA